MTNAVKPSRPAFLLALAMLAPACSTTTPYPADWARTVKTGDCPTLAGVFDNFGDWILDDDHDQRMLAGVFFASDALETNAVTNVSFDSTNGATLVKAWVGSERLYERLLSASELACESGALMFRDTGWIAEGRIGAAARVRSVYALRLASNGDLVMSQHDSWAGLIVVVPVAGKATTWLRFQPVDPKRAAEAGWPRGLREEPTATLSLRPPEQARKWSAHEQAGQCLAQAQALADLDLTPEQAGLLDGHATQAFVLGRKNGTAWPNGAADKKMGWIPAAHSHRVEKLNWERPAVADRYVLCLLEQGYQWD